LKVGKFPGDFCIKVLKSRDFGVVGTEVAKYLNSEFAETEVLMSENSEIA